MSRPSDPARMLDHLVKDAKVDALPELDWEGIEGSLMKRVEEEESSSVAYEPPMHSAAWLWLVPAAALATVSGIWWMARPGAAPESTARGVVADTALREGAIDGSKLAVPARVEAFDRPVTVQHDGRATWTLSPKTLARLERASDVIEIALDRGTLDARVVRSALPESFVVLADRTRIAVHGTAFRVVRTDHDVTVEVSEGVVSVGPAGAPGVKLSGKRRGVFSLSGLPFEAAAPRPSESPPGDVPAPETRSAAEPPQRPTTVARGAEAPREASRTTGATPASSSPSAERAVSAVRTCFLSQTTSESDLKITVHTRLSLRVLPDGRVVEALLDPPLAPAVQACVDRALGAIRFPLSERGLFVERIINLER